MKQSRKQQTIYKGLPKIAAALHLSTPLLLTIRRRLLTWFDRHQRPLPWRGDRDPYRIWVSEVMLQQTQVAAAIPYYDRFLATFPTVHDLAQAEERDVLRQWEGLGYYRRARDLHRAAKLLVEVFDGRLPNDPGIWSELPGVGRYILGAVLSQAFDRRLPIVEANSKRVLCRLFGQSGDPASKTVSNWLWQTAEELLPRKRVGDFNQSLMELGALICTPKSPRCNACPLSSVCVAHREGKQNSILFRAAGPKIEEVREVAVVVRKRKKVLLMRRPVAGRWANMWEFPHLATAENEPIENTAARVIAELIGIEAAVGNVMKTVRHSVTRFRIELVAIDAEFRSGKVRSTYHEEAKWLSIAELTQYPISSPQRLLVDEIAAKSKRVVELI